MTQKDFHLLLAFGQDSRLWGIALRKFQLEKPQNGVYFSFQTWQQQCDASKADIEVPLQEVKAFILLVTFLQVVLLGHHNVLHSDCQKINVFVVEEKRLRVRKLRPRRVWCCQQSDGAVTAPTTRQQLDGARTAHKGSSLVFSIVQ